MIRAKNFKLYLLLSFVLGCATPSQNFNEQAIDFGFDAETIKTVYFDHRLYMNKQSAKDVLHVYLDGDGTPWEHRRWIAADPTSRNPLILELMDQDDVSSIMLGRPCYHAVGELRGCKPTLWTSHRYSEGVVKSMAAALKLWVSNREIKRIVLIGYSGGGTLAMLMAPYIKNIDLIVTIAANLDVSEWNAFHGYPPFQDSLNPVDIIDRFKNIKQIHIAGGEDDVVPASIVRRFTAKAGQARFIEYPEFDHSCCWVKAWPRIMAEIKVENSN